MKEYALYKGDELLGFGTISEIARQLGVKESTIAFYKRPAYKKRVKKGKGINGNTRILVSLDD